MEYFRQRFIDELNEDGPIRLRTFAWESDDVLRAMAPDNYEPHFHDWLDQQKENLVEHARNFLRENECIPRFRRLCERVHQEAVIPFVGAGMSVPSSMLTWGAFLNGLTADDPDLRRHVETMVGAGQFEEAAQAVVDRFSENMLSEEIENCFGLRTIRPVGPINLLPFVFKQECITTNFDYIIDKVYEAEQNPFSRSFSGQQLNEAPRLGANDRHCLYRLHGEADIAQGRVLTLTEYEAAYNDGTTLQGVLENLCSNKSLLFIGCSLTIDRTLQALIGIKQERRMAAPRHYAFLPLYEETDRGSRREELEAADIHPIWYPGNDHDQSLESLLIALLNGGLND